MMKLRPKTLALERQNIGLHHALGWTLFCSRVMGFFPITGLLHASIRELKFTLKSPYTVYYATTFIGQITFCLLSVYWLFENGISLPNITNALFYVSSLISSVILAHTGWTWHQFVSEFEEIEMKLPPITSNVKKYCNIITFIILFSATVEHLCSLIYSQAITTACSANDQTEMFFVYNMPWIFNYIPYNLFIGILFEIFNIQSTFIWSYNDLLIIVLSLYLSEQFCVHNKLLKKAVKQDHFSAELFRNQYLKITKLVNLCNRRFGIYVLTSCSFNLYWICVQLFYSLNKRNTGHIIAFDCNSPVLNDTLHGIKHTIYFTFSFSFLVGRTLLVLLFAAKVNHTSSAPLMLLYEVHSTRYNVEVERFVDQITSMKVAMSGLGFFYVTRTMILTLVGSMVTYELVLLQFHK